MKAKLFIITILTVLFLMPDMAQKKKKNSKKGKTTEVVDTILLKNQLDSASYGLGVLFGNNFKKGGIDSLNTTLLAKALNETMSGQKTLLTPETANNVLNLYAQKLTKDKGSKNLVEGKAFLAKIKTDSGVVALQSGLLYKVIKQGNGEKPTLNDKVKVHYHGTLIDGTVFDSSVARGEPIDLSVNGVIPGWTEALQLMPVGSKWKLYIPSNLAYGEQAMQTIGPNSTLIFDVELISINKEPVEKAPVEQAPETLKLTK
jgi:FKBP-type peptidyl-prolyl cis-trans isomerase FklB